MEQKMGDESLEDEDELDEMRELEMEDEAEKSKSKWHHAKRVRSLPHSGWPEVGSVEVKASVVFQVFSITRFCSAQSSAK